MQDYVDIRVFLSSVQQLKSKSILIHDDSMQDEKKNMLEESKAGEEKK